MIRLLVKHGADLNAPDRSGKTLLARALAHEFTDFANAPRQAGRGATTRFALGWAVRLK
jgi:ankyrin repeat protein